jgi:hypothetical protein
LIVDLEDDGIPEFEVLEDGRFTLLTGVEPRADLRLLLGSC